MKQITVTTPYEWGFGYKGMPVHWTELAFHTDKNLLEVCKEQKIPHCVVGDKTYREALIEALPEKSKTEINRLFKEKSVKVYGYDCLPDEKVSELFNHFFTFAVGKAGKARVVYLK